MEIMGLLLFLWIVVGSSIGMFLLDRFAPRVASQRVEHRTAAGRQVETAL